jgi:hypothetical protein
MKFLWGVMPLIFVLVSEFNQNIFWLKHTDDLTLIILAFLFVLLGIQDAVYNLNKRRG